MSRPFANIPAFVRRARRDEDGSSTVEFALMLPVLMILMTTAVELGVIMTRHVMLERALDLSGREVRLGESATSGELVNAICDRAIVIADCNETLVLDMQPISTSNWSLPQQGTPCYNRSEDIEPVTEFTFGTDNEIMLIRACVIIDPMMPWLGLGEAIDDMSSGQFYLTTASAFVNEPS